VSKSRTIKRVLAELKKRDGAYTLDWIADLPLDEALEALTDLPGVGIKTASCVLLFSFGRPSMPVDTHVHRLARRLGLVARKTTADQTYAVLMAITPEELVYPFHLQLIKHGRIVCKSQRPRCAECILVDLCPSAELIG
jgi:endonuclease-3